MPTPTLPPGFDFTDPDLNRERLPVDELAELRRSAPIWWNEQPHGIGGFDDGGYWVVTKHKDVKEISKRSDVFSSLEKTALPRYPEGSTGRADRDRQVRPAQHGRAAPHAPAQDHLAGLHAAGRRAAARRPRRSARRTSPRAPLPKASGDFVEQVSCELPLQAIAGLHRRPAGGPQEAVRLVQPDGRRRRSGVRTPRRTQCGGRIDHVRHAAGRASGPNEPGEDIVTKLIEADVDGHKLSDDEFGFFVVLLAVAGNETTRNSITHGMIAFTDNPDQWELYKRERPATAVDEIVRWATPVTSFQRTALQDYELSGVPIKKGQRVVMSYRSANFDEEVFDDPFSFNILRDPNPHVGFGGTGAHYCIGANLARMTIDLMFNAIADHMPDLTAGRHARTAAVGLAQRHQALAGRLHRAVDKLLLTVPVEFLTQLSEFLASRTQGDA